MTSPGVQESGSRPADHSQGTKAGSAEPDRSATGQATKSPDTKAGTTGTPRKHGKETKIDKRTRILLAKEINTESVRTETLPAIFRRAIAAILGSRQIHTNAAAYEHISMLAEEFILNLGYHLHRATIVQRRSRPSVGDLALLMGEMGIHISDLQAERSLKSKYTDAFNGLQLDATPEPLSELTKQFMSTNETAQVLMPPSKRSNESIPSWMPQFPPDHTFRATPRFNDRVTDPRQLREMLVAEGRLAEQALQQFSGVINVSGEGADEDDEEEHAEEEEEEEEFELEGDNVRSEVGTRPGSAEPEQADGAELKDTANDNEKQIEGDKIKSEKEPETADKPAKDEWNEIDEDHDNNVMKLPDSGPKLTLSLGSWNKKESEKESATEPDDGSQPMEIDGTPTAPKQEPEPQPEPPKLKPLSLKISLGGTKVTATTAPAPPPAEAPEEIVSKSDAPKTTKMTASERNRYDPFGVKTTSKKFDVVTYVKKRQRIIEIQEAKRARKLAEQESKKDNQHEEEYIELDDGDDGQDAVDREYNRALAAIQRSKDKRGDTNRVMEAGLINWDSTRYLL
uniref:Transcription initiation factor TFIID subunit 8 n=1 Tax=Blastobotrys adeninivorans TaxID=409370 RepID=A0A060TFK8_BLAAD